MQISFEGKVVLIAGGTGGLGRSVSLAFLNERAKVAVTYRSEEEFAALKSAAGQSAPLLTGHTVDVTDEAATNTLAKQIIATHGRIDALVNTVGGYVGGTTL